MLSFRLAMQPLATFSVLSYNIHKGWGPWQRRPTLWAMRDALTALAPDLLLLQEVQGALPEVEAHRQTELPQHRFLAEPLGHFAVYGGNRFYRGGHHGNAILSRFPIVAVRNHDLSVARRWESRGALQVVVLVGDRPVHCFCVHLGLRRRWRRWQLTRLREIVAAVPAQEAVIVGGDFNDWEGAADRLFAEPLGLLPVWGEKARAPRTFPARRWRLAALDRLYLRGLCAVEAAVLHSKTWRTLSDHLPIWARIGWHKG